MDLWCATSKCTKEDGEKNGCCDLWNFNFVSGCVTCDVLT